MYVDPENFFHSLLAYQVARAAAQTPAVAVKYQQTPRELWRWRAVEENANQALYTIVRPYGGPNMVRDPKPRFSIQWSTWGTDPAEAFRRSQVLFEALLSDQFQPLRMVTIPGYLADTTTADGQYTIVSTDPLNRPGLVGNDDRGRTQVVFNCDVACVRKTS